jgi:hypothetical protein
VARPKQTRRPGRLRLGFERLVLGAIMGVAAYLMERRLRKALFRHDPPPADRNDTVHIH